MFAERTDWHVLWMQRVLSAVQRLAQARTDRTVVTRFIPPEHPKQMKGTWQRYYQR